MLTAKRLRELLRYSRKTGVFVWRVDRGGSAKAGTQAGSMRPDGYRRISVDDVSYRASRLAWLYVTGSWPSVLIDHENRMRSDNRWRNLRLATHKQNAANVSPHRDGSGHRGVCWDAGKQRWLASICRSGKKTYLGRFLDKGAAVAARARADQVVGVH